MHVDDADWNLMGEKDREKFLEEVAEEFMQNCIDYGAYVDNEE